MAGKIESAAEVLILFKTRAGRLRELERLILARHPYDTPEFLVLPLTAGTPRYLGLAGARDPPPLARIFHASVGRGFH